MAGKPHDLGFDLALPLRRFADDQTTTTHRCLAPLCLQSQANHADQAPFNHRLSRQLQGRLIARQTLAHLILGMADQGGAAIDVTGRIDLNLHGVS